MANDGSRTRPAHLPRRPLSTRAQEDAAIIARARIPEARALALLSGLIDAHPDNHTRSGPLSPGLRAELARRISAAVPEARALLSAADALLWQVVASYEGILRRRAERWSQMTGYVAADPDDLAAAARYGCWRGLLRWQPDSGAAPLHWALQWAESAAQRDDSSAGDMAGGLSTKHRSRGWDRPVATLATARLDAPASYSDGRFLLHSLIPAPVSGDDLDTRLDLHQIRGRVEHAVAALPARAQQIVRARLEGEILSDIGARLGLSRERVRQIEAEALHAIAPGIYPAPPPRTAADGPRADGQAAPIDPTMRGAALRARLLDLARDRPGLTSAEVATLLRAPWASVRPAAACLRSDGLLLPHDDRRPGIYPAPTDASATVPAQPRGTVIDAVRAALTADPGADLAALAARIGTTTKSARATASVLRMRGEVPRPEKKSSPS